MAKEALSLALKAAEDEHEQKDCEVKERQVKILEKDQRIETQRENILMLENRVSIRDDRIERLQAAAKNREKTQRIRDNPCTDTSAQTTANAHGN